MKRPEICILKWQMCFDDSQEHRSYDKENNRDSDDESSRICILKIDSISLWWMDFKECSTVRGALYIN